MNKLLAFVGLAISIAVLAALVLWGVGFIERSGLLLAAAFGVIFAVIGGYVIRPFIEKDRK
jgi:hypothetical protein